MNATELILSFRLSPLRQAEALGFFRQVVIPFKICSDAAFLPVLKQFETDIANYEQAVNPKLGNVNTEPLEIADRRRDNAEIGLAEHIGATTRHYDVEIAAAATRLQSIMSRYAGISTLPYLQENGLIIALLRDLATAEAKADLAKIGAEGWVTELAAANEAFIVLFDERNRDESGNITGLSADCRRACENSYRICVGMLNSLITVNGIGEYQNIINEVNELINYQKQVLANRKGKSN
jgi:hypothetical protein